jgi:hypothetical protein
LIGVGIRLVQDIGRHRKRMYSNMNIAEAEQWRRAFWFGPTLICRFDYRLIFVLYFFLTGSSWF